MNILELLNDNIGLVTLSAALVAFIIYSRQKWDKKRNAANTIFIEIKTAEDALENIKNALNKTDGAYIPDDIFLMPVETWTSNRHDFVKDFRDHEWRAIDNFFTKCKLYDEYARQNALTFGKNEEQIRINAHRLVADYANELTESVAHLNDAVKLNDKQTKEASEAYKIFNNKELFIENSFLSNTLAKPMYSPQKYLDKARQYASEVEKLSLSNVGRKLQNISSRSWLRQALHLYRSN